MTNPNETGVRLFILSVVVASVSACTTTEQAAEARNQRFISFYGKTMSQFMRETSVIPHDAYESMGQKVFVANKGYCTLQISARANGDKSGPDYWIITNIQHNYGCYNV
jgi:hypothetical protein